MGKHQYDYCSKCKRPYSEAEKEERHRKKVQNAYNSLAKAKANGKKLRRRKTDTLTVKNLRQSGFRIKAIANMLGVSVSAVHRHLKVAA